MAGQIDTTAARLDEAFELARKADMRHLKAEVLTLQSQYQSGLGHQQHAVKLWESAQKLFMMLKSPKASTTPDWLSQQS
jgi:hypothetical protein